MQHASYRRYQVGIVVLGLFTIIVAVILAVQAVSAKQDIVTAKKAEEVASKLNSYVQSKQSVPDSLDALKVNDIPSSITYAKKSTQSYEFCVTYKSASQDFSVNSLEQGLTGFGLTSLGSSSSSGSSYYADLASTGYLYLPPTHKKGQTCQTVQTYSYPSSYSSPLFSSSYYGAQSTLNSSLSSSARDSERKTDLNSLQTQLEAYFAQNGNYPSLADMNSPSWRSTNMRSLDNGALQDPQGSGTTLASSPAAKIYAYSVTDSSGKSCESNDLTCARYTLTATLEAGGTYSKTNLD
ncbi:MAG TPA: hypothetical protein VFI84_01020 [Candidatus Saccharimonadales bacterium]|nr:hypothetical protein [Candidatus Saccharimonadales bacterium]